MKFAHKKIFTIHAGADNWSVGNKYDVKLCSDKTYQTQSKEEDLESFHLRFC